MLFTPARHESLADDRFDEVAARAVIGRIAERAERELDRADGRWALDPADAEREGAGPESSLYCGAAGVAWALGELADEGHVDPAAVDRELVETLAHRLVVEPDDPDLGIDGLWTGVPGVLAVAERRWPDATRRDRLAELVHGSLALPAFEPMYGHPGHMLLAAQLHARTGEARWAELWSAGAELLLDRWSRDEELEAWLWTQRLGAGEARYLGAAHGLVGNAHALLRGGLLPPARRADVERRVVESLSSLAVVADGHANWPVTAGRPLALRGQVRVQWCHGAAGVLIGLGDVAPEDDAWSDLLLAAGRLVWDAGPLRDAPGLCHGTAGNAYALLALWGRTGDLAWLERARLLGQHAAGQVERRAARLGHGRHSLFTGDEGVAVCLASCLAGDPHFPVADRLMQGPAQKVNQGV